VQRKRRKRRRRRRRRTAPTRFQTHDEGAQEEYGQAEYRVCDSFAEDEI
jgi:hypothetical protein